MSLSGSAAQFAFFARSAGTRFVPSDLGFFAHEGSDRVVGWQYFSGSALDGQDRTARDAAVRDQRQNDGRYGFDEVEEHWVGGLL